MPGHDTRLWSGSTSSAVANAATSLPQARASTPPGQALTSPEQVLATPGQVLTPVGQAFTPVGRAEAPVRPGHQTRAPTAADVAVGVRIRALRRAAGRTQKQLAVHVGVTNAQLHRYETGISRVATSRLVAIAKALDVRVEDLLNDAGARTEPAMPYAAEFASLARAFAAIADPNHRAALVSLANTMAGATAVAPPGGIVVAPPGDTAVAPPGGDRA
jgi:transcriptional regulator with XRE-family HTH domain